MYARRLQVQERMTQQVADFLMERLEPTAWASSSRRPTCAPRCAASASRARSMTTAAVLGLFRRNDKTRAEFFAHLDRPAPGA